MIAPLTKDFAARAVASTHHSRERRRVRLPAAGWDRAGMALAGSARGEVQRDRGEGEDQRQALRRRRASRRRWRGAR